MFQIRSAAFGLFLAAAAALPIVSAARAATLPVEQGDYKLPAWFDPEVTLDLETEEWARVWRPVADGKYPLILMLHGNHGTCGYWDPVHRVRVDDDDTYTYSGTCPKGYSVAPSHLGYDYFASDLASHGYVVVSIDADRGINAASGVTGDEGLNLRRGRLVLRHMQDLWAWNTFGGAPKSLGFQLKGILDFNHVGLMGHSRGGEGMRAAVEQYQKVDSPWPSRIGPVHFEALFEIGPVDGQTSLILNNTGMQWNVLLPGCDGDVSDLEGLKPYDRSLLITSETKPLNKSTFQVFGANHDFYNTEWMTSDASGCDGETPLFGQWRGSPKQRDTARDSVIPFFLAHLGPNRDPKRSRMFDPSWPLPSKLSSITIIARGFTPAPYTPENFIVDNFNESTGTSSEGVANEWSGLTEYVHGQGSSNDDPTQRAAAVNWDTTGGYLQVDAAAKGSAVDITDYPALEFRVTLRCFGTLCSSETDPTGDVDFSISLADKDDNQSTPVTLKSVAAVHRPVASQGYTDNVIFQTVRVPVSAFTGADPTNIRGVRFTFDKTSTSSIFLGDVRFTRKAAGPGGLQSAVAFRSNAAIPLPHMPDTNSIISIHRTNKGVEIELGSSRIFPVTDALPVLTIGNQSFRLSRFPIGKTDRIVFVVTPAEYAASPEGAPVSLRIGGADPWNFGALHK